MRKLLSGSETEQETVDQNFVARVVDGVTKTLSKSNTRWNASFLLLKPAGWSVVVYARIARFSRRRIRRRPIYFALSILHSQVKATRKTRIEIGRGETRRDEMRRDARTNIQTLAACLLYDPRPISVAIYERMICESTKYRLLLPKIMCKYVPLVDKSANVKKNILLIGQIVQISFVVQLFVSNTFERVLQFLKIYFSKC